MRILLVAAILPILAQCTAPPSEIEPTAPAAAQAEGARDCIDFRAVTSRGAEDERTIRFDLIGGAVYRNRLPDNCPGLRQASRGFGTLTFSVDGNSLCRGDIVRVLDPGRAGGSSRAVVPCVLGEFIPAEPAAARP